MTTSNAGDPQPTPQPGMEPKGSTPSKDIYNMSRQEIVTALQAQLVYNEKLRGNNRSLNIKHENIGYKFAVEYAIKLLTETVPQEMLEFAGRRLTQELVIHLD